MTTPSRLTCEDALRRLDEYVDRALSPAELREVQAHLSDCVRCAQEFGFEVALVRGIGARLKRLRVPPSLIHRIRLRLRAELGQPRLDS